jgi:hypothetical protein
MTHSRRSATADNGVLTTSRTGWDLLADPLLNKGTAFTEAERDTFGLHGLLPPHIGTLDEQVSRRLMVLHRFACLSRTSTSCCRSSTPRRSAPAASNSANCSASRAGCF